MNLLWYPAVSTVYSFIQPSKRVRVYPRFTRLRHWPPKPSTKPSCEVVTAYSWSTDVARAFWQPARETISQDAAKKLESCLEVRLSLQSSQNLSPDFHQTITDRRDDTISNIE